MSYYARHLIASPHGHFPERHKVHAPRAVMRSWLIGGIVVDVPGHDDDILPDDVEMPDAFGDEDVPADVELSDERLPDDPSEPTPAKTTPKATKPAAKKAPR